MKLRHLKTEAVGLIVYILTYDYCRHMTLPFSQIVNGVLDFQQDGFILKILNGTIILRVYFDQVFCFWVAIRYHFLLTRYSQLKLNKCVMKIIGRYLACCCSVSADEKGAT